VDCFIKTGCPLFYCNQPGDALKYLAVRGGKSVDQVDVINLGLDASVILRQQAGQLSIPVPKKSPESLEQGEPVESPV